MSEQTPQPNIEVVRALERFLADAKAGKWQFIAIALSDRPENVSTQFAGKHGLQFTCYVGLDLLKQKLIESLTPKPAAIEIARPALIRPGAH